MEYEMVTIRLPRVLVHAGVEICVKAPSDSGCVFAKQEEVATGDRLYLLMYPVVTKPSRPSEWRPPRLSKGWLTWDGNGGWWWWPTKPKHTEEYGWVDAKTGCGGDGQEIAVVMEKFLGCPCCDGFDERECIWEVG